MRNGVTSARKDAPAIACPNCGMPVQGFPNMDRQPRICTECQSEVFKFTTVNRHIVVDMKRAPDELKTFIRWGQSSLEHLEFLQLMLDLEVMFCGEDQDPNEQGGG